MTSPTKSPESERKATAIIIPTSSPRFLLSAASTPTAGAQRKIGIAVDLSDESAFAVEWAVENYLRPGDAVILLHVRPTSVLYGADWGAIDISFHELETGQVDKQLQQQKLEDDFDSLTSTKANDLAQPLVKAQIPFKIHIVKDIDMKERLCLEVERLGLSTMIMGSRGVGASRRNTGGRLGSVSDYCVRHCVCPVVIVRFHDEKDGDSDFNADDKKEGKKSQVGSTCPTVMEEDEQEYHDAVEKQNGEHGPLDLYPRTHIELCHKESCVAPEMTWFSMSPWMTIEQSTLPRLRQQTAPNSNPKLHAFRVLCHQNSRYRQGFVN